ncbi:hypothetical protein ACE1SV_44010 [Streptomyces sennicomposti]
MAVGWVPSIQMYSALKLTGHVLRVSLGALAGAAALRHWGAAVDAGSMSTADFPSVARV